MSSKRRPGFELVHSGTWWKDFHAARRERQARAANSFLDNAPPNLLTGTTYTFVPGQNMPIVTVAGAPARKSAPSVSAAKIAKTTCAYVAPSGRNTILATRTRQEKQVLERLTSRDNTTRPRDGSSEITRPFVEERNRVRSLHFSVWVTATNGGAQARIRMARNGYLGKAQDFATQTDDEILAYLKTPRGKELLAALCEQSSRLAQECRQKAIAAARTVRRMPRP
ncbi:hypothetical protein B0H14DRAFT_2620205 [Mycena olivaceomarginata]|nr:hypothetical protein B0H14DRAFT_2620205 [Mycena olivaceomarginata]